MRAVIAGAVFALALAACGQTGPRPPVVDLDSGSHAITTGPFQVPGTWDVKYSWDCSKQHSEGLKSLDRLELDVYNSDDDSTAFETPVINGTGSSGGSTVHYQRGGWYYINIACPCDWRLQVIDKRPLT